MSVNYVKIYYGPCESLNSVAYKPQKLRGLIDHLQKLGYRVDIAPVEYVNYCVIEMCGHEVFRCNINNFRFNIAYNFDPVCKRAIDAVTESTEKFKRARSYLWFWTLIDEQIFTRSEFAPKNSWAGELELKSFSNCLDCVNCCNILAFKK